MKTGVRENRPQWHPKENNMGKKIGEVIRRCAFNTLDFVHGGRQNRIKEVNKYEIVHGITPSYEQKRLRAILDYAKTESPFYQRFLDQTDLSGFPVLKKRDFVDHYDEILSIGYAGHESELYHFTTSGSTGTPFTVAADPGKMVRVNMNFMAVMELNGFRLGMKRGEFRAWIPGKNTRSPWTLFKTNLVPIDISNMGDETVQSIYDEINDKHIQVLVTYSSALTALVNYAERKHMPKPDWDVEMIFTMGEALPESTRDRTEQLFGIRPVLSYGNNENGFIAVSLNGSDKYTIDMYSYYVEILKMDSDEPAGDGELGRIVVTDYYNRAFPMIRYDTGDTGRMHVFFDENGRKHAEFTEIYGRRGSLIYNTKGEPLSIHVFMNNLLNFEGILRQARCIQTGEKQYTLQLNPEEGVRVDEEAVVASYKKYLGEDAEFSIEYIDGIPVQQSGKTMVCVQECPKYLNK